MPRCRSAATPNAWDWRNYVPNIIGDRINRDVVSLFGYDQYER